MYVYKITNKINNKIYIGITNDYKKRWSNEKSYPSDPKRRQVIQEAIHKYGKENFIFEVLFNKLSVEEACEKEIDLINNVYHCLVPNGYNVDKGGKKIVINEKNQSSILNSNSKLTIEDVIYIKAHRNLPMYVLYDDFSDKITYKAFKQCYRNETYLDIVPTVEQYPYNLEFSSQFNSNSSLEYDEIKELRIQYSNGVYWRDAYQKYQNKYSEWDFWNVYNGNRYKLVMPEIFTKENKIKHSKMTNHSGENNGRAKITKEDVIKIRELHENKKISNSELYKMYPQLSTTSIRNIINYKTWKNL